MTGKIWWHSSNSKISLPLSLSWLLTAGNRFWKFTATFHLMWVMRDPKSLGKFLFKEIFTISPLQQSTASTTPPMLRRKGCSRLLMTQYPGNPNRLSAANLTSFYSVLHKTAVWNWTPSTNSIVVTRSLVLVIFTIGTSNTFNFGKLVFQTAIQYAEGG